MDDGDERLAADTLDCLEAIIKVWIAREEAELRRMDGLAMMAAYCRGRIAALSLVLRDGLSMSAIQAMERERE